ncbi:hypothetical protein JBL43_16410 [Aureibaculum sp. A20]|uniref:Lipoprotein n=1 Tax=Aureibaculum flavum TaxID=2795986 RepID=A0ABS0WV66_9FLAO|nr:hypothetical protein [Aureibaculum flavum]MBJ2175838.1 hypothetical protein [Aureibaculum flavum]
MKNKASLLLSILLLSASFGSCQNSNKTTSSTLKVTPEMVAEQEAKCLDTYLITEFIEHNHDLDTLSVKEIKTLLTENFNNFKKNKKDFISRNENAHYQENNFFDSLTKPFSIEDEKIIDRENILKKLVNNNHLNYQDSVQKGIYFKQKFKKNKNFIEPIVRNNGSTIFKFSSEETIYPFYNLNLDSEEDVQITQIYYHDSEENNLPTDEIYFPLNPIKIPQMKHVDSVAMSFKVKYLSKVDTLHFTKADIGVQKGAVKLLKMQDNYVEYELPYNYYPYHKGTLIEKVFYNNKEQALDSKYSLSNTNHETVQDYYQGNLDHLEDIVNAIKDLKTREEIYLTLRYLALKNANVYLRSRAINRHLLKGNVSSFTLYLENTRDTISFSTVLKNSDSVKEVYVNTFEEKTEFIDKDGQFISSIPHEITFLKSSRGNIQSTSYFQILNERYNYDYYFLNRENAKYTSLPYSNMEYLCPSILMVSSKDDKGISLGIQLISTLEPKVLTDVVFNNFRNLNYSKEGIVMYKDGSYYNLYDQNNQIITPDTSTPITKVSIKKVDYN